MDQLHSLVGPPSLLTVPLELRFIIRRYVFGHQVVIVMPGGYVDHFDAFEYKLLLVCKQLHREAQPFLISCTELGFHNTNEAELPRNLQISKYPWIRHLTLEYCSEDPLYVEVLSFPNLQSVELLHFMCERWHFNEYFATKDGKALEMTVANCIVEGALDDSLKALSKEAHLDSEDSWAKELLEDARGLEIVDTVKLEWNVRKGGSGEIVSLHSTHCVSSRPAHQRSRLTFVRL